MMAFLSPYPIDSRLSCKVLVKTLAIDTLAIEYLAWEIFLIPFDTNVMTHLLV